jgi:transposase InsO family protein
MNNNNLFPVEKMCKVLKVSRSAYYNWCNGKSSKRAESNSAMIKEIRIVYNNSKGTYGSPRIAKELNSQGISTSKKRVAKLMKKEGIQSKIRKKYKITTDSSHKYPVVENKLDRNFIAEELGAKWVSDITYIHTNEGWLYLTAILDLADRKVIGWALSDNLKTSNTIIPAWNMAIKTRPIHQDLLFHSDRGIQYACEEFTNHLDANKYVTRSMSRKGNCWDNAVAESFFKTLKVECVYHIKFATREQAELAVFEYIETWYNRNRRHSAINGLTILEFEQLMKIKYAA